MSNTGRRMFTGVRRGVLAALCLTAMGVSTAWADQVTTWSFNDSAAFTAAELTDGSHPTTPTYTLSWGSGGQSSLVIDPHAGSGSVDTDGASVAGAITLTHNNFPINGATLDTATLTVTLNLTPFLPNPGPTLGPFTLDLGINFFETPNGGPCINGDPTPCPDIFVIGTQNISTGFTYDGYQYYVNFFPSTDAGNISYIDGAYCTAAGGTPFSSGAHAGQCLGFVTQENASNQMLFGLSITSEPLIQVPEPGALGMMGLGLMALAGLLVFRRRKLEVE